MDLRIGIIGFGMRGTELTREAHRPGSGSHVAAVCEVSERGRAAAASAYPDALITADLDELLAHDLDAAMVFTPDDMHARTVIPALDAGLAVFSEKPLATSIADCDAILEAAHRNKSRLYVGHNMRHMPVVTLMRDIIARGTIGEVKAVWCRHFVGHGGDYYFKDWHAERSKSVGMLLQKGAHDIDVIHWLAGRYTTQVQAMGELAVYGDVTDRRDRSGELMGDWFSVDNWPPTAQTGLNPVIDIEDISQVNMRLGGGVLASYEQCHFTPDYWRNYTVIGTHGRLENFGDESGSEVGVWTHRLRGSGSPDETHVVPDAAGGHGGADALMIEEFLRFAREGGPTTTSPVAARNAVATGVVATQSLRGRGETLAIPPIDADIAAYFDADHSVRTAP
ncbi:Gfo/Idh/MocA family protein [Microbacterium sp. MPKO10]|uniref:Gfo/Idh/MocA family protein n=1 Tax=Microbacterium sp. MPKO10 TaxID=2989818 RepID=UPI002235E026|nr:Gfo/Idh/MocA family oxidoreductase [Microbacterium sp. MPKO10]MCW4457260.1 Gfo/Idh/MocA family oxidoreductase [Microbacterium sp. MPKO10]